MREVSTQKIRTDSLEVTIWVFCSHFIRSIRLVLCVSQCCYFFFSSLFSQNQHRTSFIVHRNKCMKNIKAKFWVFVFCRTNTHTNKSKKKEEKKRELNVKKQERQREKAVWKQRKFHRIKSLVRFVLIQTSISIQYTETMMMETKFNFCSQQRNWFCRCSFFSCVFSSVSHLLSCFLSLSYLLSLSLNFSLVVFCLI